MTRRATIQLSAAGQARREAMLAELTTVMRDKQHARRVSRTSLGAAASLVVATLIVAFPGYAPVQHDTQVVSQPAPLPASPPRVQLVRTDHETLARYDVDPRGVIDVLDDNALLAMLAAIDQPAGLVRIDGRTTLTPH